MKRKQIKAIVIVMSCVMSITLLGTKSLSVLAAENFRDTIVMNEGQSDSGINLTDSIAYSAESDFYFDGKGTITGYKGTGGDVVIPNTIGGVPVTTIASGVFKDNLDITSISMPSVKTIGEYAFRNCSNLKTVYMPQIETIGELAFYDCMNLTTADMPQVTTISSYAFYNCSNLTIIDIPQVTIIPSYAFSLCNNLEKVYIPEVTSIGSYAFAQCSSLTTVDMPKVMTIENDAFDYCSSLTTVDMPKAETLGKYTFAGCYNLKIVNIPEVISIGETTFIDCYNLTTVNMPKVTRIGWCSFANCKKLTTVDIPQVTIIEGWAFNSCSNLTTVNMPEATMIGGYAFAHCDNLAIIDMPKVITIGEDLFSHCDNLTTVNMPQVTNIGQNAFNSCSNLTTVNISNKATIEVNAFKNCLVNSITLDYGTEEINASTQKELNILIEEWNDFVDKMSGINKSNVTGRFAKNDKILIDLNKELEVPDTIAPEITLNGDSIVNLEIGATYEENGVTITDNSGETIEPVISISYNYNGSSTLVDKVDTSKVGSYTITYTATDSSGNSSSAIRTVSIRYNYSLVTKQIKDDGSSVFKAGSTIPIKIQLKNINGDYISTAIAKISLTKIDNDTLGEINELVEEVSSTSGNLFRYDEKNNQYIYNLSTKRLDKGTYELKVILDDGNTYSVQIGLR